MLPPWLRPLALMVLVAVALDLVPAAEAAMLAWCAGAGC
jgi:hypothetical protein